MSNEDKLLRWLNRTIGGVVGSTTQKDARDLTESEQLLVFANMCDGVDPAHTPETRTEFFNRGIEISPEYSFMVLAGIINAFIECLDEEAQQVFMRRLRWAAATLPEVRDDQD